MSTIDDATVIANLRETVERLSAERDSWRRIGDSSLNIALCCLKEIEELRKFEQKGDQQ